MSQKRQSSASGERMVNILIFNRNLKCNAIFATLFQHNTVDFFRQLVLEKIFDEIRELNPD